MTRKDERRASSAGLEWGLTREREREAHDGEDEARAKRFVTCALAREGEDYDERDNLFMVSSESVRRLVVDSRCSRAFTRSRWRM